MKQIIFTLGYTLFSILFTISLFAQQTALDVNFAVAKMPSLQNLPSTYNRSAIPGLNTQFIKIKKLDNTGLEQFNQRIYYGIDDFKPENKTRNSDFLLGLSTYGAFGGSYNTATGTQALNSNVGSFNTADGYQALYANTSAIENTGVGFKALYANTTGSWNTAIGSASLSSNTTGAGNSALGFYAMLGNTTGSNNTGIGSDALEYNLSGSNLTALGYSALGLAYAESFSVAIGSFALANSNSGTGSNTAIGANSMNFNTSGYYNVASGANAMYSNTTGFNNTASGVLSMYLNTIGTYNVATGIGSMYDNTSGNYNVGNGTYALESNSSGVRNTAVGAYALESSTTGDRNSALGYDADINAGNLNNATAIGAGSQATASNSVVIGSSAVTSVGGYANWTNFSDGRYKQNIQQNVPGLAFINKLKPITYTLDISGIENKLHENQKQPSNKNGGAPENFLNDPRVKQSMQEKSAIFYSGFIAQDVEKAADSLSYNFSGIDKPKDANQSFYGLRYGDFVVPLVKAVQELSLSSNQKDSTINSLQEKVDALQSQINEIRAMLLSKNQISSLSIPGASLDQNVPNPISNSTTIAYGLPQGASSAQMQITDMTGKILQTISLSGVGRNTLTLDTSSYASGTYCYSLLINGQLAGTKKMVSVR